MGEFMTLKARNTELDIAPIENNIIKGVEIAGIYGSGLLADNITMASFYIDEFKKNPPKAYYSFVSTLAHEIIHQLCSIKGIKDIDGIQYHNKNFKKEAEAHGLKAELSQDERLGYVYTTISRELYEKTLKSDYIRGFLVKYAPIEAYINY